MLIVLQLSEMGTAVQIEYSGQNYYKQNIYKYSNNKNTLIVS